MSETRRDETTDGALVYLDCASGVAGDKLLAALVDAGAPLDEVVARLRTLPVEGWAIEASPVRDKGLAATRIDVAVESGQPSRTPAEVEAVIAEGSLGERATRRAVAVVRRLAEAEAAVHGVPVEEVRLHEVGAVDAVVDITGVCVALDLLDAGRLVCSPIPTGTGTVESEHGTLPVPAPATARLLEGVLAYGTDMPGEVSTPTGVALVSTLADAFGRMPRMTIRRVGHGAGRRELPVPNVLRAFVGRATTRDGVPVEGSDDGPDVGVWETVSVLETAIDHLDAEEVAFCAEELLAGGALDAWTAPLHMKKGRPGVQLTVLADPADAPRTAAELQRLTGSLGVRVTDTVRRVVSRKVVALETSLGTVRFKTARHADGLELRPEYEDCARIAREQGKTLREVRAALREEARRISPRPRCSP